MIKNKKHKENPRPYASLRKRDSRGYEHWHVYMPSKQGWAWVELYDLPDDPAVRSHLLDPEVLPEWKIYWLEGAYEKFRQRENARKRRLRGSESSYGAEDELADPERRTRQARRDYLGAIMREGVAFDPQVQLIRQEETDVAGRVVAQIMLPLTQQQRAYLTLSLGEGLSYADIARLDHPDASQAEINKRADAIRNCVNRALKRIRKKFGPTRPDQGPIEDV